MQLDSRTGPWAVCAALVGITAGALLTDQAADAPVRLKSQPAPVLGPPVGRPATALEFMGFSLELRDAMREVREAERRLAIAKQRYLQLMEDVQ